MKVLTSAIDIREALGALNPSSVAVAYVGKDLDQYISLNSLQEIVLSPTLGTNPKAVEYLMRALGEENVYFLDNLHSKFFIGDEAALLGSCNLSNNGMSDRGLFEAAVLLSDSKARKQLKEQLELYKKAAREMYPTAEKKMTRLRKLLEQENRFKWFVQSDTAKQTSPNIVDYKSTLDRIHICWYGRQAMEPNRERIKGEIIEAGAMEDAYKFFDDDMAFAKDDDVRVGDWILTWSCNDDGFPHGNGAMRWIQVHYVIPNGFIDDEYPLLAGQAKAKFIAPSAPPFRLDKSIKSLIKKLLDSGKFPQFLSINSIDEAIWKQGPADTATPAFLAKLREEATLLLSD